jgi:hypothetical protein
MDRIFHDARNNVDRNDKGNDPNRGVRETRERHTGHVHCISAVKAFVSVSLRCFFPAASIFPFYWVKYRA